MESMRGKILKVPDVTPGLLFVNGQQRSFEINGIWKSINTAPSADLAVDVEFGDGGDIIAVRPVSDSDLAKEQAKKAVDAAGERGKQLASLAIAKVGKPTLITIALLIVSWFFLDYYSTTVSASVFSVKTHITLWQGMGALNVIGDDLDNLPQLSADLERYSDKHGDKPSSGIYGVIFILALVAPLLPVVWKDKRAFLGALLPLVFILGITTQYLHYTHSIQASVRAAITKTYTDLAGVMSDTTEANQQPTPQVSARIQTQVNKDLEQFKKSEKFNLGLGFYISSLAVLYLAWQGSRRYLALKGSAM
jgi:hypothetical protein